VTYIGHPGFIGYQKFKFKKSNITPLESTASMPVFGLEFNILSYSYTAL